MTGSIVSGAPHGTPEPVLDPVVTSLLRHADDNMVMAQRLGKWISNAPELEEDIALGNFALDHLGVARALYTRAGEAEGKGRTEDDLAMFRNEREFLNLLLVEQPNGDFAQTMVRQFLFDAYQVLLWDLLSGSEDEVVAGVAARAAKEAGYHLRHSREWVIRLGDGTGESHRRTQAAVDELWKYTGEMFEGGLEDLSGAWLSTVSDVFATARLAIPDDPYQRSGGRRGFHSEHLGFLLAEMQWMQRSYPGLSW